MDDRLQEYAFDGKKTSILFWKNGTVGVCDQTEEASIYLTTAERVMELILEDERNG